MKLKWIVFFIMGIVQYSTGQNNKGFDLRGSSDVVHDVSFMIDNNLFLPSGITETGTTGAAGSSPAETNVPVKEQSLFLWNGISGVYLEISFPEALPAEDEGLPGLGSDALYQVNHLDGSQSCIETFIPALGAGTFNGLLDAVGSKDSINYRLSCFQSDIGYAFGNFGGDEIEVRSSPTDHSTQGRLQHHTGVLLILQVSSRVAAIQMLREPTLRRCSFHRLHVCSGHPGNRPATFR
jgi:hypothetical protein